MADDSSPQYDQLGRIRFPNGVQLPIFAANAQPDATFAPFSILKGIPMIADDPNNTKIELVLDVKLSSETIETVAIGRFKRQV